ncbi:hypothetical protein SELMODRAFT_146320 [Selaginella moellendorffii]|nr:hypothetical protein SELMODRAFT_146320 [Selaginella moellendorffii]
MFFCSGFVVNLLQVCSLVLLPFSRGLFRAVNMSLFELASSQLVWMVEWWAGVEVRIYADEETRKHFGKEHALIISNHRSDIDWLVGWIFASRVGCLDGTRAIMKKSSKFLPVIGWGMWFTEYIFLERKWEKDENTLKIGFQRWKNFPRVLWVALFVEGTRFTEAKLKAAQEYAASAGLPVPRNVLVPRTKGFVCAVDNLRSFIPAVYDVTFALSKYKPAPTMTRILNRQSSVVHMHVRRVPMNELPTEEEELTEWCREVFVRKDDLLDKHKAENTFGEELYVPLTRSYKPLMIVIMWASLLTIAVVSLLARLLKSASGIAWFSGVLVSVTALMQVAILATQSERSTPAKRVNKGTHRN